MAARTVRNLIDGEWVESVTGRTQERRNPADTREVVSTFPESDAKDADAAVSAVAAGWQQWADTGPEQRARVLESAAGVLERQQDSLIEELVREEGKTRAEATMEVSRTPMNLRFYAGEAMRTAGVTLPTGDGSLVMTLRAPVGVVAAITPWNFPLNIPSRKLGPALAAGNGVVFKPSEVTPLLGQRLVDALLEGGLPSGAIAVLHGGAEVASALVTDERVHAVTFTGSTAVGEAIHRVSRASQRTQLEMGGKNPLVVLEDADLDRAATLIAKGAFGLSGQACTGTSRVIVHDAVHDALVERIAAKARALRVGPGLAAGVDMGPQATERQRAVGARLRGAGARRRRTPRRRRPGRRHAGPHRGRPGARSLRAADGLHGCRPGVRTGHPGGLRPGARRPAGALVRRGAAGRRRHPVRPVRRHRHQRHRPRHDVRPAGRTPAS